MEGFLEEEVVKFEIEYGFLFFLSSLLPDLFGASYLAERNSVREIFIIGRKRGGGLKLGRVVLLIKGGSKGYKGGI